MMKGSSISLEPAVRNDADLLLSWRNLPEIVSLGSLNRVVSKEEHVAWFAAKLASSDSVIWIVKQGKAPIGQVRLDVSAADEKVISIFLLAEHTGKGYGIDAIRQACALAFERWSDLKAIRANILSNNVRSIHAFKKGGFRMMSPANEIGGMISLKKLRPMVVSHNRLTHGTEERKALHAVLRSGMWASGKKVEQFECRLQEWAQVKHVVCVGSGLAALRLALSAMGVTEGDKVALPGYSCVALANAVLANRGSPLVADIEKQTWNIDFDRLANDFPVAQIKAVIGVNTFGLPLSESRLKELKIDCLEDWAHGFRLEKDGVSPAALASKVAIQSFYATKLIGAGEGGAILTNSSEIAEHVRNWRDYSDKAPDATRLNDKMTDITASIGIVQLSRLPSMIRRRAELANRYAEAFSAKRWISELIDLPLDLTGRIWYRYPVYAKYAGAQRMIEELRALGVMADMPIHDWRSETQKHEQMVATDAFNRVVSLPLYPTLSLKEQNYVIKSVLSVLQSYREDNEKPEKRI